MADDTHDPNVCEQAGRDREVSRPRRGFGPGGRRGSRACRRRPIRRLVTAIVQALPGAGAAVNGPGGRSSFSLAEVRHGLYRSPSVIGMELNDRGKEPIGERPTRRLSHLPSPGVRRLPSTSACSAAPDRERSRARWAHRPDRRRAGRGARDRRRVRGPGSPRWPHRSGGGGRTRGSRGDRRRDGAANPLRRCRRQRSGTGGPCGRIDRRCARSPTVLVNNAAVFVLKGLEASVEGCQLRRQRGGAGTRDPMRRPAHAAAGGRAIVNIGSVSSFVAQRGTLSTTPPRGRSSR